MTKWVLTRTEKAEESHVELSRASLRFLSFLLLLVFPKTTQYIVMCCREEKEVLSIKRVTWGFGFVSEKEDFVLGSWPF